MARCPDCKGEMDESKKGCVDSCIVKQISIGGKVYKRNTTQFDNNKRCHDCGIKNKKGHVHHFGCDMERCPKCKGQIISCDCEDKI
jgi:predicted Zn-ribbon and HTH transcriptional regulator